MLSGSAHSRSLYEQVQDETDTCLRPFLFAESERDALRHFDRLDKDFITVDIQSTVLRELWRGKPITSEELYEINDSLQDMLLKLRGKIYLRLLKLREQLVAAKNGATPVPEPIRDLRAYTVAIAEHGCVDYLRRKYPGRHALDISLRATCTTPGFPYVVWRVALDTKKPEWRIGEQIWQEREIAPLTLREDLRLQNRLRTLLNGVKRANILSTTFSLCRAPIRYQELLSFLAEILDVEATYREAHLDQVSFRVSKPYLVGLQPEEIVNRFGVLQDVWHRITPLSPPQVATLLLRSPQLNEGSFLDELVRFEVATWEEIATKTGIAVSDLQNISRDLPLTDEGIAQLLHIETDSVRRIRQDARLKMERHSVRKNK